MTVIPDLIKRSTRDGFGKAILEAAENNKDIVVLTANLGESTRLQDFINSHPDRFFDCGVAEQNMAGVAAGLALSGKIPFITSFATFSPGRNWEQIRVSIAYNNANVKIASTHAGLSVGHDGATHQALEDIALIRVIPNIVVISPADYLEAKKATIVAAQHKGPVYLRLGREPIPVITNEKNQFEIGRANILKSGKDVAIIATGLMVYHALLAAEKLKKIKISAEVVNCHTIKPLDEQTILKSAQKTRKIITAEEHQIYGGLGSAISELLCEKFPIPVHKIGLLDTFGESGTPNELLAKYKCDSQAIFEKAKAVVGQKAAAKA